MNHQIELMFEQKWQTFQHDLLDSLKQLLDTPHRTRTTGHAHKRKGFQDRPDAVDNDDNVKDDHHELDRTDSDFPPSKRSQRSSPEPASPTNCDNGATTTTPPSSLASSSVKCCESLPCSPAATASSVSSSPIASTSSSSLSFSSPRSPIVTIRFHRNLNSCLQNVRLIGDLKLELVPNHHDNDLDHQATLAAQTGTFASVSIVPSTTETSSTPSSSTATIAVSNPVDLPIDSVVATADHVQQPSKPPKSATATSELLQHEFNTDSCCSTSTQSAESIEHRSRCDSLGSHRSSVSPPPANLLRTVASTVAVTTQPQPASFVAPTPISIRPPTKSINQVLQTYQEQAANNLHGPDYYQSPFIAAPLFLCKDQFQPFALSMKRFGQLESSESIRSHPLVTAKSVKQIDHELNEDEEDEEEEEDEIDRIKRRHKQEQQLIANCKIEPNEDGEFRTRASSSTLSARSICSSGRADSDIDFDAKHADDEETQEADIIGEGRQVSNQIKNRKQPPNVTVTLTSSDTSADYHESRVSDRSHHRNRLERRQFRSTVLIKQESDVEVALSTATTNARPFEITPPDAIAKLSDHTLSETTLQGEPIACFVVGGEQRLCLPQIFTTVLSHFMLPQITQTCSELQINYGRCSSDQLVALKATGVLPPDAPSCGLITKSDAERLCAALLQPVYALPPAFSACLLRNDVPDEKPLQRGRPSACIQKLIDQLAPELKMKVVNDFPLAPEHLAHLIKSSIVLAIRHRCFGKTDGLLLPALYVKPSARCVICVHCQVMLSPRAFICHSHQTAARRTCHWGFDASNWRLYLQLHPRQRRDVHMRRFFDEFKLHVFS